MDLHLVEHILGGGLVHVFVLNFALSRIVFNDQLIISRVERHILEVLQIIFQLIVLWLLQPCSCNVYRRLFRPGKAGARPVRAVLAIVNHSTQSKGQKEEECHKLHY